MQIQPALRGHQLHADWPPVGLYDVAQCGHRDEACVPLRLIDGEVEVPVITSLTPDERIYAPARSTQNRTDSSSSRSSTRSTS